MGRGAVTPNPDPLHKSPVAVQAFIPTGGGPGLILFDAALDPDADFTGASVSVDVQEGEDAFTRYTATDEGMHIDPYVPNQLDVTWGIGIGTPTAAAPLYYNEGSPELECTTGPVLAAALSQGTPAYNAPV